MVTIWLHQRIDDIQAIPQVSTKLQHHTYVYIYVYVYESYELDSSIMTYINTLYKIDSKLLDYSQDASIRNCMVHGYE